jgi:hypothetical protein
MRKLIISILLAGAAASPALAQDQGRWHHDEAQSNNQQSREDRSQAREQRQEVREQRQEVRDQARAERFNGGVNAERMQQAQQAQQTQQQAQQQAVRQYEGRRQQGQAEGQGGRWDRSRFQGQQNVTREQVIEQQQQQQAERSYRDRRGYRGGFAGQAEQTDQAQRDGAWRNRQSWSQDRSGDFRQRDAQQRRVEGSRWANGGWNRDWRNDRRYDWRHYRDRHRSVFRLGIYFDPFGYGYRPFDVGYNLAPLYFGQRYWIDPAMYGLPYPPPGTVWVRYWNDAVLVDTYSGEVVDVIHNFFW